jgi:hypothetical protein
MRCGMSDSGFCTACGFKIKSFEGLNRCPNCDSNGRPCSDKDQVNISINWQELRILCIWAERWGNKECGGAGLIYNIAHRIQKQHPEFKCPLTLAEEVQNLPKELGLKVQTNIPGVETNKNGEVI